MFAPAFIAAVILQQQTSQASHHLTPNFHVQHDGWNEADSFPDPHAFLSECPDPE
jgi:hypothetical protein